MSTHTGERGGAFISYPTERVVGTIEAAADARAAIDALSHAGFASEDVDVLHGEDDLARLDPTGAEHGFLARFQRTLVRRAGPAEEYQNLMRHVEDVRAGRFVLLVHARLPEQRRAAAEILSAHRAAFIGFYGIWSYEAFDRPAPAAAREDSPDRIYDVRIEDRVTRVRVESESDAVVSGIQPPFPDVHATLTRMSTGGMLLSWQDAANQPVVHVVAVASGTAYAVLRGTDGRLRHAAGTCSVPAEG